MALKQSKTSKPLQVCVPTDIILEILFRLPVVSLLRFKSVCKLWFSLISDPYFINRHVKNNEYANHLRRLISTTEKELNIKTCHLCDVLHHDKAVNVLEIDSPFKDQVHSVSVVAYCNGFLCLRFRDYTYCIWNPSTRRSSIRFSPRFDFDMPGKAGCVYGFGFGYDESTDDYKVVELGRVVNLYDALMAYIYSLKSGNWKIVDRFPQDLQVEGNGTFLNGALHWLAGGSETRGSYLSSVVTFDLATETYCGISRPPYDDDEGPSIPELGAFGEWLCVVRTYVGKHADLWVMKAYELTNSWVKLFSIPYPTDLMRNPSDAVFAPLCILDDGRILLQFGSKLVLYDLKNKSLS